MSQTERHYSLGGEAFKSFLIAFPLSLVMDLLAWIINLAFSTNLLHHRFWLLLNLDAWPYWKNEVVRNAGFIPFTFVMLFLIGVIQFLVVCLPFAKLISNGVRADAGRSMLFYATSGALLGGGPWILLVSVFVGFSVEIFNDNAIFIFPSLTAGLIAGMILRYRLNKLATKPGIEISIK